MKITLISMIMTASVSVCTAAFAEERSTDARSADASHSLGETDVIFVTGRAQKLYRVGETDTGKLPTDPFNATQIITSINNDLIRDQGARDAQELYRNIAGVSLFSYSGVQARGFRQEEIFFDGLRGNPYIGFSVPQLFNIERVDFLKGPAGMLYGPGEPGGLFNYVTKKPSQDFSAELRGIYGTEARIGGSFEITGALPVEGTAGRAGVFVEDRNTPRENTASRIAVYDGGFSAELPFALLTLQATRYEQDLDGNRLRGVPVDDDGNFLTDRRWNHNEASDFQDLESNNFQAILDGDLGSEISWNVIARYTDSTEAQQYHEPVGLFDADDDDVFDLVEREFRDQLREEDQVSIGANLIWDTSFGAVGNRFMVGYEYFDSRNTLTSRFAAFSGDFVTRFLGGTSLPGDIVPLRLDTPNYGQTQPGNYAFSDFSTTVTDQLRHGAYALNETTIGKFTLVGGVRFDSFNDVSNGTRLEDEQFTYRVGGLYKPVENVALFAQWADSYAPQLAFFQNPLFGGPFEPTTGTIVEGGVRTRLFDDRFFVSVSAYNIKRQNILQLTDQNPGAATNPFDFFNDYALIAEVTSTGVELETVGDITPNWVLTASYAYNDVRITEDNGNFGLFLNNVGDRFVNAPEHQAGFWTRYQVPAINTAFAFGGDYVSERVSFSGQRVQPYFVADASVIWDVGDFEILLRVNNLFDEEYAASGFGLEEGHFPGDPRSVFVELSRKW